MPSSTLRTVIVATKSDVVHFALVGIQVAVVVVVVFLHCILALFGVVVASFAIVIGVAVKHRGVALLLGVFIVVEGSTAVVLCVAYLVSLEKRAQQLFGDLLHGFDPTRWPSHCYDAARGTGFRKWGLVRGGARGFVFARDGSVGESFCLGCFV